ncbi:MAG: hypothetical protein IPK82_03755 [Polyangiaceae bacterium]|nr:hypothetical protein [Polyangiaceae bacterium]
MFETRSPSREGVHKGRDGGLQCVRDERDGRADVYSAACSPRCVRNECVRNGGLV